MDDLQLGLHSRGRTYGFVLGVVVGVLVAGLAVPYGFGSQLGAGRTPGHTAAVVETQQPTTGAGAAEVAGTAPAGPVASQPALPPGTRLTASDVGVTATTING